MKSLYSMMIGLVLILPASQAKQQALAFRVEKYVPAIQQSINDASLAGDMSVKVALPNVDWKDYSNIVEYLEAGGYKVGRYGDKDSQALIVKW
jgi:hypothetical protein